MERKAAKPDLFVDPRAANGGTMEEWDQAALEAAVAEKHGADNTNRPTEIICKVRALSLNSLVLSSTLSHVREYPALSGRGGEEAVRVVLDLPRRVRAPPLFSHSFNL